MSREHERLAEADAGRRRWRRWGPYVSERQWGTVREDLSPEGAAWEFFPHDHARSRAYLRGEDGLAGICDDRQFLCFAVALHNGVDPILKERLFGLTNSEGNHGEDVKELYYYLDSTPTHSYMRYLYKYPQSPFPYGDLVGTNARRSRLEPEYELLHTGIFDDDRYFDVEVEYAKAGPEDLLIRITATNRGPDPAPLVVLPTLWFRNRWKRSPTQGERSTPRPTMRRVGRRVVAEHYRLGERQLRCDRREATLLFCDNETNTWRLFGTPNAWRYPKDAFDDYVVGGRRSAVNPLEEGTKAAYLVRMTLAPGASETIRLRLEPGDHPGLMPKTDFDALIATRRGEADEFYAEITSPALDADERRVFRQAMAGMLWSKQYYTFDVSGWLDQRGQHPLRVHDASSPGRNADWFHMVNADVISMPDKWEYPWYAAWDLAFHCAAMARIDLGFAKEQMLLMLSERYQHPNGQIPAYEWAFGDVNPPVHAWATLFLHFVEKTLGDGKGDPEFLARSFQKLVLNFTWWVNRTDPRGANVFAGGFLGLDNIGVFDRSAPLPTGGFLEQADGTAWMALYCLNMLEMALELGHDDRSMEDMAIKFAEHFLWIAVAMNQQHLWDEEDGFFYDVLRMPDGHPERLKVRSFVGLVPFCAVLVLEKETLARYPKIVRRMTRFLGAYPELIGAVHPLDRPGVGGRHLLSVLDEPSLRRVLARLLDPEEFLGDYGIRSLSRAHRDAPFVLEHEESEYRVDYQPADSTSETFGGNSNWRGPIWAPINALIIRTLIQLHAYYGDEFRVECPTGSGNQMNLFEVASLIAGRLASIFTKDPETGRRAVFGEDEKLQTDPHFRDHLLFYEYFHGDDGRGIGASHQTGWTGLVALMLELFAEMSGESVIKKGRVAMASHVGTRSRRPRRRK